MNDDDPRRRRPQGSSSQQQPEPPAPSLGIVDYAKKTAENVGDFVGTAIVPGYGLYKTLNSKINPNTAQRMVQKVQGDIAQARAAGSQTTPTGSYSQRSGKIATTMAEHAPEIKNAEEISDSLQRNINFAKRSEAAAQEAKELNKKASNEMHSVLPSTASQMTNATENMVASTASEHQANAERDFDESRRSSKDTLNQAEEYWNQGAKELAEADNEARRDRINNYFATARERIGGGSSWFNSISNGLVALGGLGASISDRGLLTLNYDQSAAARAQERAMADRKQGYALDQSEAQALAEVETEGMKKEQDLRANKAENLASASEAMGRDISSALASAGQDSLAHRNAIKDIVPMMYSEMAKLRFTTDMRKEFEQWARVNVPLMFINGMSKVDAMTAIKAGMVHWATSGNAMDTAAKVIGGALPFSKGGKVRNLDSIIASGNPDNEHVPDTEPAILAVGEYVLSNEDVKKIRNGLGKEVCAKVAAHYAGGGKIKAMKEASSDVQLPGQKSVGGNAVLGSLSGAGTGASIGGLFGPIGAGVGAAIGGITGGVTSGVKTSRENAINAANSEEIDRMQNRAKYKALMGH